MFAVLRRARKTCKYRIYIVNGYCTALAAVIKIDNDLIIINKHRIDKRLYQPLLTLAVGVVLVAQAPQEIQYLLPRYLVVAHYLRFGDRCRELFFVGLQLVHALLCIGIKNASFQRAYQIGDRGLGVLQFRFECFQICVALVFGEIIVVDRVRDVVQQLVIAQQSQRMVYHDILYLVFAHRPLVARLVLLLFAA